MESVRVILQAVNENNTTLALKTVEAELQKNSKSDVYLALKVFVASRLNDRRLVVDTAQEAVKLCSKKTMEMFLIPALVAYNQTELLSTAFVRTNRLDPQDSDITEGWIEVMLLLGDLSATQKALMAQLKHSKKPRLTCYQACLVMGLSPPSPIFPLLAERMLEKHLPVNSPQECYVVALVRKMSSQRKMVEFLQLPANAAFVAASLDLQQLLLTGLHDLELWDDLMEYAKRQLERIDSFNYWQALNSAAVALGAVEDAIDFNKKFKGNNASLAKVDLVSKSGHQSLETAVVEYWQATSTKPSAFDFLRPYVTVEIIDALQLSKRHKLAAAINLAKLKALVKHPAALTNAQLFELYERHKTETPQVATDYFVGSDALLLAAANVLRAEDGANFSREKAATILEYAASRDPHQFYVRLLLIEIYRSLGAQELANKHFDTLSIRNIQFETIGHLLATRAGSISPKLMTRIFDKLFLAHSRVPNMGTYATASLNDGAFTQFEGIFALGKQMRYSMGYALLTLEKVKSSRINRGAVDMSEVVQIPDPVSMLLDNRDFKTSFDTEASEALAVGPRQGAEFIEIQRKKEIAFLDAVKTKDLAQLHLDLEFADAAEHSKELTVIEKWNVRAVADILAGNKPKDPPTADSLGADWAVLHWCYTVLETIRVCKDLRTPVPPSWTKAVRSTAATYAKQLDNYVVSATAAVNAVVPFDAAVVGDIKNSMLKALDGIVEQH